MRGGEARFKGLMEGEDEYTADKLRRIANELARSYDKFVAYLDREGFLQYIPRKIDASSNETSLPSGTPLAK